MLFETEIQLKDYLIVVAPPERIVKRVRKLKKIFLSNFGTAEYLNSKAHISLCHFHLPASREGILKMEMQQYLGNVKPFEVSVSGPESFASNRLIFLRAQKSGLVRLQRTMVAVFRQRLHMPKKNTPLLGEPHVTIAKANSLEQYNRSWDYFKKLSYFDEFTVDTITVLRRKEEDRAYEIAFETTLDG